MEIWIRPDGINSASNFKPRPPNFGEIATMLKVKKRLNAIVLLLPCTFSLPGHLMILKSKEERFKHGVQ